MEETLALYLSSASSWRKHTLPTKPCRATSAFVGKAYVAAGQVDVSLYTMVVLQAYQAELLKELDHGEGLPSEAVEELHRATDLALHVTKQTVCAISRLMAVITMVVTGRHLWLSLIGIKERDKTLLLDPPLGPFGRRFRLPHHWR